MADIIKFYDLADHITGTKGASDELTDRLRVTFANGYGISIVRGMHTYGGPDNLFTVGVTVNGYLTYDTPITNDVIGFLTAEGVLDVARKVCDLPVAGKSINPM